MDFTVEQFLNDLRKEIHKMRLEATFERLAGPPHHNITSSFRNGKGEMVVGTCWSQGGNYRKADVLDIEADKLERLWMRLRSSYQMV
jgi:hypothetical protein